MSRFGRGFPQGTQVTAPISDSAVSATVAAGSAAAIAAGDDVVIRAATTILIGSTAATASGDAATFISGTHLPGDAANATASGDAVGVRFSANVTAGSGVATASGDPVTVSASAVLTGGGAAATGTGDPVAISVVTVIMAGTADATAGGHVVALVITATPLPPFVGFPPDVVGGAPLGSGLLLPGTSGFSGPSQAAHPGYFRIKLTSLHRPANGALPIRYATTLARIEDFQEAQVEIPFNDARSASVKISMNDPACLQVLPLKVMLHIVYVTPNSARLVFWGPVTVPEWSSEEETVTINAVDPSLRLAWHYIRLGDQILNAPTHPTLPNPYGKGMIPLDGHGLRMLRDCGVVGGTIPYLGIADGVFAGDEYPNDTFFKIKPSPGRGSQVWQTWLEAISHQAAPDFELEPRDDIPGAYCRINTFNQQGNPDPLGLILHDGFGKDNCRIDYRPGGKLITHAHILSQADKLRITIQNSAAATEYGAYIWWDSTNYKADNTEALALRGRQLIAAYSSPPDYYDVKLNPDSDMYFMEDFGVGDLMIAAIRRGYLRRRIEGRVVQVTLKQIDDAGNVVPEIQAAATLGDPGEDPLAGDE